MGPTGAVEAVKKVRNVIHLLDQRSSQLQRTHAVAARVGDELVKQRVGAKL